MDNDEYSRQQEIYQMKEDRGDFDEHKGRWIAWYNEDVYVIRDTERECMDIMSQVYQGSLPILQEIGAEDDDEGLDDSVEMFDLMNRPNDDSNDISSLVTEEKNRRKWE